MALTVRLDHLNNFPEYKSSGGVFFVHKIFANGFLI